MKLFKPPTDVALKGGAVVVHGFNTSPGAMDNLALLLSQNGFLVSRIVLKGLDSHHLKDSDRSAWLDQISAAAKNITESIGNKPLIGFGFSLGGALTCLSQARDGLFAKIVLISPALSLTKFAGLVRGLIPLGSLPISLPSMAPKGHAQTSWVRLSAYGDVVAIVDAVSKIGDSAISKIPILVFMCTQDELISPAGVRKWLDLNAPQNSKLIILDRDPSAKISRAHIIIDQDSAGQNNWPKMTSAFLDFIAS